jgi:signal peptidase I
MDFSLILVLIFGASGLILLTNAAFFKRRRAAADTRGPLLIQHARSLFPVMLVVQLIRSFAVEPFRIPSASMMPGLVDGNFIAVIKFS